MRPGGGQSCSWCYLLYQKNSDADSIDETRTLVIPAEFADWIDDLIHFPQGHSVHLLVEFIEVCLDLFVVIRIDFAVAFVEHGQDGVGIAEVEWMGFDVRFYGFQISFQGNTSQKIWVMLHWKRADYK
jgi:hypothetical protein